MIVAPLFAFFDKEAAPPDTLGGIAAILTAIAWPLLVAVLLYWFRDSIAEFVSAAVRIAESSNKFKIWQIEFDRDVDAQIDKAASHAMVRHTSFAVNEQQLGAPIPPAEVEAATRVRMLVAEAPAGSVRAQIQDSIKQRMLGFAQEYETTRASMAAGPERTRAMNAVAAKMRTLALAAEPFLPEFQKDEKSPGKRLAAICILELAPDMGYVPWLADRMAAEQPFVFFHASVALLSAVRRFGSTRHDELKNAIDRSIAQVNSFGSARDMNTVRSLTLALSELETAG